MHYQEYLDDYEKLVAVRGNAVVTCSLGDGDSEDKVKATLKLWMLRTERIDTGYGEMQPLFGGNQGQNVQHGLPPLAPMAATGNSAASTFKSITSRINSSGGSGSGIGGSSPRQSPSVTLHMLRGRDYGCQSDGGISALGVSHRPGSTPVWTKGGARGQRPGSRWTRRH